MTDGLGRAGAALGFGAGNAGGGQGDESARSCINLNPTLPPHVVVLQVTPCDDLCGLGKHGLDFYQLDRGSGIVGLNHPADQKVLLLGHGLDGGPFAQQQFFGVQGGHG
jgi:hypothetical protein